MSATMASTRAAPFEVSALPAGFTDFFTGRVRTSALGGYVSSSMLSSIVKYGRLAHSGRDLDTLRATVLAPSAERGTTERVTIKTPENVLLDGVLVHGRDFNVKPDYADRKVIFFAMGLGGIYEAIADPEDAAKEMMEFFPREVSPDVDVLIINYEGMTASRGSVPCYDHWALDNYCALKFLQARGYQPGNMLIFGHSMGGWHTIRPLAWFRSELPPESEGPSIVSYNSFNNAADASLALMGRMGPWLIDRFGWNDSIKDILLTFPKGKVWIVYNEGDTFISEPYRLATKLVGSVFEDRIVKAPIDRSSRHPSPHLHCPGKEVATKIREMLGIRSLESIAERVEATVAATEEGSSIAVLSTRAGAGADPVSKT